MIRALSIAFAWLAFVGLGLWSVGESPDPSNASAESTWETPPKATLVDLVSGIRGLEKGFRSLILHQGSQTLLIDPVVGPEEWKTLGLSQPPDLILLSRHDRHITDPARDWQKAGVAIWAPAQVKELLHPTRVEEHWQQMIPLRSSRCVHFLPAKGLLCRELPETLVFGPWTIRTIPLPGPSPFHQGFFLQSSESPTRKFLYCGQLCTGNGKLFAPFTTDWDHWTDQGLAAHARSLALARSLQPMLLIPALGPPIRDNISPFLETVQKKVDEAGFLKSFERFSKMRLGSPPNYPFLAREQAESNGSKPWSRLSDRLWLTGNTYILASKSGDFVVVDPWDPHSAKQIPLLQKDAGLGKLEGILCTHAHFDHFDGVFSILQNLNPQEKPKLWSTALVAAPLEKPLQWWAPFLDRRPLTFDQKPAPGESIAWREYRFRFHEFSGQTRFTQAVEVTVDGRRCLFTGDNFFHQDQFSGSGGWMGLNRSSPLDYARSAQLVLDLSPEWILAEHGGPFVFHPEDFRRRVAWGKAAAAAADALCETGNHQIDWTPHRFQWQPVLVEESNQSEPSLLIHQMPAMAGQGGAVSGGHGNGVSTGLREVATRSPWPQSDPGKVRTRVFWENGKPLPADCFQIRK